MTPCQIPSQRGPNKAQKSNKYDDGPRLVWKDTVTTVMVRNLHNRVTQRDLLYDLHSNGFDSAFDFLYLPIDIDTNRNRGYFFINFASPELAKIFKEHYEDLRMAGKRNICKSGKLLKISPAFLQGLAANFVHYSTARVKRGPPETRPLFLRHPDKDANSLRPKLPRRNRRGKSPIRMAPFDQQTSRGGDIDSSPSRAVASFCYSCGGKMSSEYRFCILCGAAVVNVDVNQLRK
jgi:RNA recognition motif-containing protein